MADLKELGFNVSTADVTLVTTAETSIITSDAVYLPTRTAVVVIVAVAQLTTGAATTTVTPRIRKGSGTGGTVLNDAVAEAVKAAAGSSEPFIAFALESVANEDTVQYSLTLAQAAATGNGTATQAAIVVFVT